ncbi:MAG: hypothetical protein ACRDZM_17275, partial [Acidimicrobiia bacterium]
MTGSRLHKWRAMALVAVLALVATACGDGSNDASTTTGAPDTGATTTTAGEEGETTSTAGSAEGGDFVTVAVLAPLTGEIGEFGQIVSEA